jgi:hypothetical protein
MPHLLSYQEVGSILGWLAQGSWSTTYLNLLACCTFVGKPISKCGKCGRYMKYIAARPSRLYCPSCEEVYALPQVGHQHSTMTQSARALGGWGVMLRAWCSGVGQFCLIYQRIYALQCWYGL